MIIIIIIIVFIVFVVVVVVVVVSVIILNARHSSINAWEIKADFHIKS